MNNLIQSITGIKHTLRLIEPLDQYFGSESLMHGVKFDSEIFDQKRQIKKSWLKSERNAPSYCLSETISSLSQP